jgi:hypothetical protein
LKRFLGDEIKAMWLKVRGHIQLHDKSGKMVWCMTNSQFFLDKGYTINTKRISNISSLCNNIMSKDVKNAHNQKKEEKRKKILAELISKTTGTTTIYGHS